jgi:hypothetical protein
MTSRNNHSEKVRTPVESQNERESSPRHSHSEKSAAERSSSPRSDRLEGLASLFAMDETESSVFKRVVTVETRDMPMQIYLACEGAFTGLLSEQYPNILLPPEKLSTVYISISSEEKASFKSKLEVSPVQDVAHLRLQVSFGLAVHSKSSGKVLWHVRKSVASLLELMQALPLQSQQRIDSFTPEASDTIKWDVLGEEADTYLSRLLSTRLANDMALTVCEFLSSNLRIMKPTRMRGRKFSRYNMQDYQKSKKKILNDTTTW